MQSGAINTLASCDPTQLNSTLASFLSVVQFWTFSEYQRPSWVEMSHVVRMFVHSARSDSIQLVEFSWVWSGAMNRAYDVVLTSSEIIWIWIWACWQHTLNELCNGLIVEGNKTHLRSRELFISTHWDIYPANVFKTPSQVQASRVSKYLHALRLGCRVPVILILSQCNDRYWLISSDCIHQVVDGGNYKQRSTADQTSHFIFHV